MISTCVRVFCVCVSMAVCESMRSCCFEGRVASTFFVVVIELIVLLNILFLQNKEAMHAAQGHVGKRETARERERQTDR